jgi:DNA helicase HerA-like ATPase
MGLLLTRIYEYLRGRGSTEGTGLRHMVVIEEAHAFISKEKRDRMLATLMLLIETARRGRKRGLNLGIVTQQPTHLPTELLELCNTRVIHRTNSTANIEVLRESTGNVPDEMWSTVTSLRLRRNLSPFCGSIRSKWGLRSTWAPFWSSLDELMSRGSFRAGG